MFDFKFDWRDELNTGVKAMDEQHKELFRIVRDMEQLLLTHCIGVKNEQLYDIIRQLREFVSYHFYEEEELMEKYDYALKEEHKKKHEILYQRILAIDIPKLGKYPYEELSKIKEQVQDVIFAHMFQDDKAMGDEIFKKMNEE